MGWICGALGGFRFFGTVLIGSSSKKSRFSCVLWQVDFTEKITKSVIFIFYFSNQYYCTHGYSRHILTCNMNFESPNALVFIVYKEFLKKIFQTTKIGKNMSRIFFYSPLSYLYSHYFIYLAIRDHGSFSRDIPELNVRRRSSILIQIDDIDIR